MSDYKKTILITGSSKGLGKSLALEFSSRGYNIIIHGRDKNDLENLKKQIETNEAECVVVLGDVRSEKTINALVKEAKEKNIDVLINNAGIYLNSIVEDVSEQELKEIMEVNFFAPVKLIKGILPLFKNKNAGLIININSLAGKQGTAGESSYCASKHAFKGFSDSLKFELTKYRIRVIDFYPGAMVTPMLKNRRNLDFCIQPKEAAKFIADVCNEYSSLTLSEINIYRRKYE